MHVFHRYHNQCAVGHLLFEAFRGRPSVGTTRNQRIVHVFGCPQLGHIGRDVDACYSTDGAWQLTLRESRADEFPSDGNGEAEALPIEEAGSAAYPERCTLMHTDRSGNPYGRTDIWRRGIKDFPIKLSELCECKDAIEDLSIEASLIQPRGDGWIS
ncbi:hypothetical protein BGZ61DRAFT_529477 [Ilyonectria robusta]|uniref:uncharacterized protein n=1 Tax=Ilyonectria robusta TaxID=1079257 RepID=UPI001E8DF615|nr:uncharacterized protein BGZ61DRAFT_529477 [Ilyonectria robusta]KAH8729240.1 hypothetical protein BGZ61DRAFT_529477 [Ilyonectria robusta]